jgi:hypothetical protein
VYVTVPVKPVAVEHAKINVLLYGLVLVCLAVPVFAGSALAGMSINPPSHVTGVPAHAPAVHNYIKGCCNIFVVAGGAVFDVSFAITFTICSLARAGNFAIVSQVSCRWARLPRAIDAVQQLVGARHTYIG